MLPYIHFFGIEFVTYTFVGFLGIVLMMIVFCLRAKHYHVPWKTAGLFCLAMSFVGMLANKGMFILAYLPGSLEVVSSTIGADSWGNFFVYIPVVYLFSKCTKYSFGELSDCFAPGMLTMFVLAQIGCYLNGCCGGIKIGSFAFPVQMLEACLSFGLLMYVLYKDQKQGMGGKLYPLIMITHGAYRFFADFLRASQKDLFFSRGQWLAVISVIIGFCWLRYIQKRSVINEQA